MPDHVPPIGLQQILILGKTVEGKAFRPSDWAERLAGVMSQFRPEGGGAARHIGYSPWCSPGSVGELKCVIAHRDLQVHEPMAWDFLLGFARDNRLLLFDGAQPRQDATP